MTARRWRITYRRHEWRKRPRFWTPERVFQLNDYLDRGWDDARIAAALGTTANGVNLARKRRGLAPRRTRLLSARQVSDRLGLSCAKAVARWIEAGHLRGQRGYQWGPNAIWRVSEDDLLAFLANADHWHRWQPERIPDAVLRGWATELRGGVTFLTPGQAAWRLCVTTNAVNDWIHAGLLPAVRNGNWLIRSDVVEAFIPPGQRSKAGMRHREWTPFDDRRLLALRASGRTWDVIGQRLDRSISSVANRWYRLTEQERAA